MRTALRLVPLALFTAGTALAQTPPAPAPAGKPAPPAAQPAAPAAPPAPPAKADADEAGHFKIYGKLYADFSYAVNQDLGADTHEKTTAFDMKRFYLGVNYTLTDIFSAKFQTDIGDHNKHYDVFVKAAYFQAKFAPEFTVRAGVGDNPWIPYAEHRYGYRYVENTLIDRLHYGNSADWGVHVLGDIAGGKFGYQVSVVNGHGYADPTRAHVPTGAARLNTEPVKHLNIAVGTSVSTLGAPGPVACPQSKCPGYGTRFDGLIAWDSDPFRVGVEGFLGKNYTADQISGAAPEDTARGISGFANVRFIPMLGMFGRFDYAEPTPNTDSGVKDMYFNVGLDGSPTKFLELALVYKWETVKSGAAGAVLNKVGSTVPDSKGRRQEIGLFSQLKF